jgi:hypothetical protein
MACHRESSCRADGACPYGDMPVYEKEENLSNYVVNTEVHTTELISKVFISYNCVNGIS